VGDKRVAKSTGPTEVCSIKGISVISLVYGFPHVLCILSPLDPNSINLIQSLFIRNMVPKL
jgi:hypothetical protein